MEEEKKKLGKISMMEQNDEERWGEVGAGDRTQSTRRITRDVNREKEKGGRGKSIRK